MRNTAILLGTALLLAACGGSGTTSTDMAGSSADMAGGSSTALTGLPTGCAPGVTADTLLTSTYKTNCALAGCHAAGGSTFVATTAAELRALVGKAATQTTKMPLVTAGDPQKSYLMYKLLNQQSKAGGGLSLMPLGASKPQPDADLCKYLVWIQEGAK